ncbi:MAG: hypothetical protein EB127_16740 [Alphaproteobacteria bacterium]|nr:hypothetical protein [Alphaproteobacteria bacterium]
MGNFLQSLNLNDKQLEAVSCTEGPLLVLAGAGTGKTKVLTSRIAHILNSNLANPYEILAVTFTNKASKEMQHRISTLSEGVFLQNVGTFHSVASKVLRRHANLVGLSANFSIIDYSDQLKLVKTISAEFGIEKKDDMNKQIVSIISRWKDMGLTYNDIMENHCITQAHVYSKSIYPLYQKRLLNSDLCDFGDLILYNTEILENNIEVLHSLQRQFKYILIDEYQDTNLVQYRWVKNLAAMHKNICCVGDDDQSIYSWRGAEIANILRFEKDFPGAKVIAMEQNYRSTQHILLSASSLIKCNNYRHAKTLWTNDKNGELINVIQTSNQKTEAHFVISEIKNQIPNTKLSDNAILVRASFQTRPFEEALISFRINYKIIGGLKFYERAEIKDIAAYLRLILNLKDDVAFERIVNLPRRSVGPSTILIIKNYATINNLSLFEATKELIQQEQIKGKLQSNIQNFLDLILHFRKKISDEHILSSLIKEIYVDSGYQNMLKADKGEESRARAENINELIRAAESFKGAREFMEHISLVMENESILDNSNFVSIMTIHAAKGLEFETVFIPGMEEGIFPHQRSIAEDGAKGLEEERRLAYVGITRAKRNLFLLYAEVRHMYNELHRSGPSRFLSELPATSVRFRKVDYLYKNYTNYSKPNSTFIKKDCPYMQGDDLKSPATKEHRPGARVFHAKFGRGIIIRKDSDNLEIAFDKGEIRTIKESFVSFA